MTTCSRCNSSKNLHLVSALYQSERGLYQRGSGRLLVYCVDCVNECCSDLYLNIPLEIITSQTLEYLYKNGYSSSDPRTFLEFVLGASNPTFALNDMTHKNYLEVANKLGRFNVGF